MTRNERIERLIQYFTEHNPDADSELVYTNPFELLVATILSAKCTDRRVNSITPTLFAHYPDAASMAKATEADILALISSVSYPNSKARYLKGMATMLVNDFDGKVPSTVAELTRLPGVGRKTANVVEAVAFGKPAMPVDTHVFRVSHRLGLVSAQAKTPAEVEKTLVRLFPAHLLSKAHHWLLLHGRYVCTSRAPHCDTCPLEEICPKRMAHAKLQR